MMQSKILVYEIILRYVLCIILCSNLFCISSLLTSLYFLFPIYEFTYYISLKDSFFLWHFFIMLILVMFMFKSVLRKALITFFCVKNDMVDLHPTFLHYVSLWCMPFHIEIFCLVCPTHSFYEM